MNIQERTSQDIKNAEAFFNRSDVSQAEKDKWIARYHELKAIHSLVNATFYSSLVGEKYHFEDYDMVFDSGVRYSFEQQKQLLKAGGEKIKSIHEAMRLFDGSLEIDNKLF